VLLAGTALAQSERRTDIDVQSYTMSASIDPAQATLSAKAEVVFIPNEDRAITATFELNNNLSLRSVKDGSGAELQAARTMQDSSVKVGFPQPMAKGQPVKVVFEWEGRLTGEEESPIYGLKFAALRAEVGYLLYPSRWFPISGYTSDRYSMQLTVTAPDGYRVIGSGLDTPSGNTWKFEMRQSGFPGSIALVKDAAQKVQSQGVTTTMYFRGEQAANAPAWGEESGKVMTFLSGIYGVPAQANLTFVQTVSGAPAGYSAPGIVFLSPSSIGKQPSQRLLANQLARQWWGNLASPASRNHIWLANGPAKYSEVLYVEHANGASSLEGEIRDLYVDAMTVTDAPVRQSSRFEDYTPEFFAVTGSKGAATLHMLRGLMGEQKYTQAMKAVLDQYANKSLSTDDFRKVMEQFAGINLQGFFIQWLESTGAPEFKMTYTVYRTQKGFRVMGKINQDLDTFRMPVNLRIETEGNPEDKVVDVVGPSTDFLVDTFGKPRKIVIDPQGRVLRLDTSMRVAVAIRRGEQFAEIGEYNDALKEYQKALEVNRISSLAHYRVAEVFFLQGNYQSAANEFREALNGDQMPKWTEVWSHINLGKIFDVTQQRERARNEYNQALRTKDNTQGALEEASKYLQTPYQRSAKD
jgi:tetratricopeptide (TPR) repeat protein